MNYIKKIVQALEDSNILLEGVTKIIKHETKEQKGGFLSMLLGTLGANLLGNLFTGKGIVRAGTGNKKGKGIARTSTGRQWDFNTTSSFNNLPKKIKNGAYVINLDEYADVGTHWIALFCNRNEIIYFDSFGVKHIPEEIKKFIDEFSRNKNIKTNIFRVQENDSVMCGYFCIGFIDFMLAGKKLTHHTNLFSPHDFKKNDHIILSCFKNE